jgi:hypothetical protein
VLAGRGRGWIGGGPKARARSRGPGCSFLFLLFLLFLFLFFCFVSRSNGGEQRGLTSWPRPGGGNPVYICHGRKAAVCNMKKQTNKRRKTHNGPRVIQATSESVAKVNTSPVSVESALLRVILLFFFCVASFRVAARRKLWALGLIQTILAITRSCILFPSCGNAESSIRRAGSTS